MKSNVLSRAICVHTGPDTYLDHLGVLAVALDLPLFVTEPQTYEAAKKYYPDLKIELISHLDLSLEFLATHYDVIFESGHTWALEMRPLFELLFQKKMRIVYCPHGNSDKGASQKKGFKKDISLIYGNHMRDLLTKKNSPETLVEIGNFRLPYYLEHQNFYRACLKEKISYSDKKKTILYAPTWADGENPTSFFTSCARITHDLGSSYNLIVKLHPFLFEQQPAHTLQMIAQHEDKAFFLTDFPPIYPLLDFADIYLGDFSSIAYDFLAFNKPLYFLYSKDIPIHRCGLSIPPSGSIRDFIDKTYKKSCSEFEKARQDLYAYAFGKEKTSEEIKEAVVSCLERGKNRHIGKVI